MAWIALPRRKNAPISSQTDPASPHRKATGEDLAGSQEVFRRLFEDNKDRVFSIALSCLEGDRAAAEDVTQEVFVRLATHRGQFRGEAKLSTYLYRITVNLCHDERRRRKPLLPLESAPETPVIMPSENLYDVHAAIARLEEAQQRLIVLRYFEGLEYEEIATPVLCRKRQRYE
jgi:RNA polymerase sigma-70 factor, ECF subfamily